MGQITFPTIDYTVTVQPQGKVLTGQSALNFLIQIDQRDYIKFTDPKTGTINYLNDQGSCICSVEAVPTPGTVTIDDDSCDFGCGNCVCAKPKP